MDAKEEITRLLTLMARLRDPQDGCSWDLEQSYRSIAPSTIEEAYEVVDAIESEDFDHLEEELGDLLFQVVFYAQLASEEKRFSFSSIAKRLTDKLVRRHPHVFPEGTLESRVDPDNRPDENAVLQQWEAIKAEERAQKGQGGVLDDVPTRLPAITRAFKLQKRAAGVGFDWPNVEGVKIKLAEELAELDEAVAAGDHAASVAELGDVLFCVINLARHLNIEPETALRSTNQKFEQRFSYVEKQVLARGERVEETALEELDRLWEAAKGRP